MDEVEILESEVNNELVDKGVQAVEKMTFKFDWTKYSETYTQEVKELVEKKFLGEEIEVPEYKLPETRSIEAELEKMLGRIEFRGLLNAEYDRSNACNTNHP